jgi:citrate lyase subunit beta/citryl-CoA lyase
MERIASAGNKGEKIRSDCQVNLSLKSSGGIELLMESKVERIFGSQIRSQVEGMLKAFGIGHAHIELSDSGALPFVIAARLEAALCLAAGRSAGGCLGVVPVLLPQNRYETSRERPRISRLYLPGNTPSMMLNAGLHHPDGIILDLEDSVAPRKKEEARLLVRNALCQVDFFGAERMVRINQLPSGLEDLEFVVPYQLHVVLIPKCEGKNTVIDVDERVRSILKQHGQDREIFLMPIIETCLGVERAYEIATSCERVAAMAIGLEDYTADLGVARTEGGEESFYARTRLVNACRAASIQPIDSVYSDVGDMEGLARNVARSKSLGFEGMGCIHPRQIGVIHEGFRPTLEETEKAARIIEAFEEVSLKGEGIATIGTKMIDLPVVKRAKRTLEIALRFEKGN